jgi:uncharacterized RDD family membrane protein YckC
MTERPAVPGALPTPGLLRRLACMLYEGVLLFGVVFFAGLIFGVGTGQRNAMIGQHALQAFLFVVLAIYFVGFWSSTGQTLPMQTWHIRLLTKDGARVSRTRAFARYLLAYLWFVPALLTVWLSGLAGRAGPLTAALCVGVVAYAALALLHPQRQFWHDAVCGTRLVTWLPKRAA